MERRSAEEWFDEFEEIFVGRYEIDKTKIDCSAVPHNLTLSFRAHPTSHYQNRKTLPMTLRNEQTIDASGREKARPDQPKHQGIHEIRTRSAVSWPLSLKPTVPTAATNSAKQSGI